MPVSPRSWDCRSTDCASAFRIEVQVHPEDIAGDVIGTADGGELDVALVLAPRPIDHVVLSVDSDVEPRDREPAEQTPLPVAREGQALAVQEVDFRVEGPRGDVSDLAQPPEGALVHEQPEDQPVLVRLLLSHGGHADREGLPAGVAAVALGARLGSAIAAVVGRATGDANGVVGALGVWADGVRGGREVGAKAFALLDDPAVALQRWVLTAGEALQHRKLTTTLTTT